MSDLYVVILNPAADRGRAGRREGEIRRALESQRVPFELLRTREPGHATELARKALKEKPLAVVGAGGDGTLNEIAQALVGAEVPLGVIPCGSGNDLIRALGIPKDVQGAARVLTQGSTRLLDVGRAGGRFFLNSLGMGIDGKIAEDYRRMRFLKGELGYLWAALVEAIRFRAFPVALQGDGWEYRGELVLLPIQNGPYAGGGFFLAPKAQVDDGRLDMVLVKDRPLTQRLLFLKKARDGTYLSLPGVEQRRIRRVKIEVGRPLPVHMDGELLPRHISSLAVEILPRAIRVIAP